MFPLKSQFLLGMYIPAGNGHGPRPQHSSSPHPERSYMAGNWKSKLCTSCVGNIWKYHPKLRSMNMNIIFNNWPAVLTGKMIHGPGPSLIKNWCPMQSKSDSLKCPTQEPFCYWDDLKEHLHRTMGFLIFYFMRLPCKSSLKPIQWFYPLVMQHSYGPSPIIIGLNR